MSWVRKKGEKGSARGGKEDVREEGDEELLLLITFDLPFDDIADVHHCQQKKTNVSVMAESKKILYRRF